MDSTNNSAPVCRVCNTGKLTPTEIPWASLQVRVAGYLLIIIAAIVAADAFSTVLKAQLDDGEHYVGTTFNAAAISLAYYRIVGAVVLATCGLVLAMERKVLQCSSCTAIIPAA